MGRKDRSRPEDPHGNNGAARLGGNDEGPEMEAPKFGGDGEPALGEEDDGAPGANHIFQRREDRLD
jgi:hypothetical protein